MAIEQSDSNIEWRDEFKRGFIEILPLSFGVVAYGLVFGLLCAQADMGSLQTGVMGTIVFAGASQIIAIERYVAGAGAIAALTAGLVVNLRIFLITTTLQREFSGRPLWQKLLGIHLATDENWALMHAKRNSGAQVGYWYFVGGGTCLLVAWLLSTVTGVTVAANIPEPRAFGLDFAFAAAFIAILRSLWRGKSDLIPWCTSILLAIILVTGTAIEPSWIIAMSGGIAAMMAGLLKFKG